MVLGPDTNTPVFQRQYSQQYQFMWQAANDLFNEKNSGKQTSVVIGLENLKNRYRFNRDRAAIERKGIEDEIEPVQRETLKQLGVNCQQKLRQLREGCEQIMQRSMRIQLAIERKAGQGRRAEIDERRKTLFNQEIHKMELEVRKAKDHFDKIEEKLEEKTRTRSGLAAGKVVTDRPLSISKSDPKLKELMPAMEFIYQKFTVLFEELQETEGEVAEIVKWKKGAGNHVAYHFDR